MFPQLFLLFVALTLTTAAPATPRSNICPVRLPDPPSGPDVTPPQRHLTSIRQPRIINGDLVSDNLLPYMVFLSVDHTKLDLDLISNASCTGTLISPRWVLTAAHCVEGLESGLVVYTGLRKADQVTLSDPHFLEDTFVHPNFISDNTAFTPSFDVAVLHLTNPVQGKFMSVNVNHSIPSSEEYVRSVGYGMSRSDCNSIAEQLNEFPEEEGLLRQVDVPIVDFCECRRIYRIDATPGVIDFDNILCVGYQDRTCSARPGDSGGPLIHYQDDQPIAVGVASFAGVCASDNFPTGYVSTSSFEEWLDDLGVDYTKFSGPDSTGNLTNVERMENSNVSCPKRPLKPLTIVLIAVSGVFAIALFAVIIYYYSRRRRPRGGVSIEPEHLGHNVQTLDNQADANNSISPEPMR